MENPSADLPQVPPDEGLIEHYFADLSAKQRAQYKALFPLYRMWNDRINVISRKDIDHLYVHHVLHSLGIARVVSFNEGSRILDVGTGGGFPGIPLAILFPDVHFHLVDSIGKKITVVRAVADALGLDNVMAEQVRGEDLKGEYDFVVSRAVTRLKTFHGWIKNRVAKKNQHALANGILYLKGGDLEEELRELARPYRVYPLAAYFSEPFFETKVVVHVPMAPHA